MIGRKGGVKAALFQATIIFSTMETIDNNYQEESRVFVNDNDSINQIGCSFFMEALNSPITYVSSNQLRWFTYHFKDSEKKKIQDEAKEKIIKEANTPDKSHTFKMRILLYSDLKSLMTVDSFEYIKYLLNCKGVKIRCLEGEEDQKLRISNRGTKLFLSISEEQEKQVYEGVLYEAKKEDSPMLVYFRKKFEQDFNRAKEIKLDNGKIVFADDRHTQHKKWRKSERGTTIIWSYIGAIISAVLGVILGAVLKHYGLI